MSINELITATEAAGLLGITRNGVHFKVKTGVLKPIIKVGRKGMLLFDRAEIENLAESEHVNARHR